MEYSNTNLALVLIQDQILKTKNLFKNKYFRNDINKNLQMKN